MSEWFGYMALVLMSLLRIVGWKYLDWTPVGPAYMYAFVSMKIKPEFIKLPLIFVTQTYIDSIIFPYFNKDYGDKVATP